MTGDGILCPSAQDPARNTHRSGIAWSKGAIRTILGNPRYTGFQVWNKQHKHEALIDVDDVALGHETRMRWNDPNEWIWSDDLVHAPLISKEEFDEAATRRVSPETKVKMRKPHRSKNPYVLKGVIYHASCQRRMQGQYNHERAYYRCRYMQEYALANKLDHPRNVYIREIDILPELDDWLAGLFTDERIDDTISRLVTAAEQDTGGDTEVVRSARRTVTDCKRKLEQYRHALDQGNDAGIIASWIADVEAQKLKAEAILRGSKSPRPTKITPSSIKQTLVACRGAVASLHRADPDLKASVYRALGVKITYDDKTHTAKVQVNPEPSSVGISTCPRTDLHANYTAPASRKGLRQSAFASFLTQSPGPTGRRRDQKRTRTRTDQQRCPAAVAGCRAQRRVELPDVRAVREYEINYGRPDRRERKGRIVCRIQQKRLSRTSGR
ncbi:recombinase family protein [Saccharopolyspora sp. NPDC000359]|uniref:recombinase family protein n=1 Tax=Saccharopolyspora sp. NPDC000359 TaxID=3154251 RepID=UPI003332A0A2